jgi:hypothetical protein
MDLLTAREFWFLFHLGVGVAFIHGSVGGIAALLRRPAGIEDKDMWHVVRASSTALMALAVWIAVVTGTWLVYPGYRATPVSATDLTAYPRDWLLAGGDLAFWHTFGMEWKEHVGWIAPFLATAVAFSVMRYRSVVTRDPEVRRLVARLFVIATSVALVAAALGAAINAVAPNEFLDL